MTLTQLLVVQEKNLHRNKVCNFSSSSSSPDGRHFKLASTSEGQKLVSLRLELWKYRRGWLMSCNELLETSIHRLGGELLTVCFWVNMGRRNAKLNYLGPSHFFWFRFWATKNKSVRPPETCSTRRTQLRTNTNNNEHSPLIEFQADYASANNPNGLTGPLFTHCTVHVTACRTWRHYISNNKGISLHKMAAQGDTSANLGNLAAV